MKVLAFVPSGLILALPALAEMQYYDNIEAASHITAQHETRFERDSVSRSGDWIRFDVKVGWRTPDERPETEAPLRIVRYLARCETKEIAVSGVAVFDTSRRIVISRWGDNSRPMMNRRKTTPRSASPAISALLVTVTQDRAGQRAARAPRSARRDPTRGRRMTILR